MIMKRLMTAITGIIAAGTIGLGAIGLAAVGASGDEKVVAPGTQRLEGAAIQNNAPEKGVEIDSPEMLRKQTERLINAARQRLDAQRAYYEQGRITVGRFIDASRQVMQAEVAGGSSQDRRLKALKAHWDRMDQVQKKERSELEAGTGSVADLSEAVLAHETAAFEYIAARQSRISPEAEVLGRRVDALEKRLESLEKRSEETVEK
jgi:hypothetical protein